MRKFKSFILISVALLAMRGLAQAGPILLGDKSGVVVTQQTLTAQVDVQIGGHSESFDFDVNLGDGSVRALGASASDNVGQVSFNISGQTDPTIVWNTTFTNITTAPLVFSLDYVQPFMGGPFDRIHSNYGVTLTDGGAFPGNGAIMNNLAVKTDINGVFTAASFEGPGQNCSAGAMDSNTCNHTIPFVAIPPVSGPGTFSLHVAGTLTGPGDTAGFTGRADLLSRTVVPEPGTIILMGSGLLGLALLRWKQAR